MKNAFYFVIKALSVLKIFKFLSCLFGYEGKRLDNKTKVNLKHYDVITSKQTITTHILANILRSKGNQTMKFGQLIEYNMRNIFL